MKPLLALTVVIALVLPFSANAPRKTKRTLNPPSSRTAPGRATLELIQQAGLDTRKPQPRPKPAQVPKRKTHHASLIAEIPVASGANLQTAINGAICGDFLNLEAGATWNGTFTVAQNCSAGTPLTIRSANHALLPTNRKVCGNTQSDTCSDSVNMARIRTEGGGSFGAAVVGGANAGGIVLDGIEFTDSPAVPHSTNVSTLIDFGLTNAGAHDLTITRSWFHAKETGANYNRSVQRAIWFEGQDFLLEWSYVYLIGYYYPENAASGGDSTYQMDSNAFQCAGTGDNITVRNNYLNTWWNVRNLGGADTAAQNTATLTSATTGSATFSNVTGLAANIVVRMSLRGTGTWNNTTKVLTRTSGIALNSGDGGRWVINPADNSGTAIILTPSGGGTSSVNCKMGTVSGSTVNVIGNNGSVGADGNYDWVVYQTVIVTGVAGSAVSYTPFGTDFLRHSGAADAAWNFGDQGLITDVQFIRNFIYLDPAFAAHVFAAKGYCNKGVWQSKNVNRELDEGNLIGGMPSILGWTSANQNGTAPWIKVDNVTVRSNVFNPVTGFPECCRTAIFYTDDGYLNTMSMSDGTIILPNTITVTNNLVLNLRSFLDTKYGKDFFASHNTVINDQGTLFGVNALVSNQSGPVPNFQFKDNIGGAVCAGFNGYPSAYPGATILNNLLVDADSGCSGGINVNTFGTGSGLSPVPTAYTGVDFVNLTNCKAGIVAGCALAATSPYRNLASDGTDPGVNVTTLLLAQAPAAAATCNWNASPTCN